MMIIVSDNTATEVLYRMVGGPDAVNARMAGARPEDDARDERAVAVVPGAARRADDRAVLPRRQDPVRLSTTPREMGRLLEMMERGTLVDKPSSDLMLRIMRGQLYRTRIPRYVTGYTHPAQDRRLPALRRRRCRRARGAGQDDHPVDLHRQSLRVGRSARERDRTRREGGRGLLRLPCNRTTAGSKSAILQSCNFWYA